MYQDKTVGVVVPCFNEEKLLRKVVDTMPDFVDRIYLVDDQSVDETANIIRDYQEQAPDRILGVFHTVNQGVGGAIASGYKIARDEDIDIAAVMAGDAQMDPSELESIIQPVADGTVDYTKGNRLFSGDAWNIIPRVRYIGNSILSLLTKIASGYWHLADSQSGYTAIGKKALQKINWDKMYKRYGQPNDLLVRLNIEDFKVQDIPIRPVYNIGEQSGIRPFRMIPRLSFLIFRLFLYRLLHKYIIRDFHPLVFFYLFSIILTVPGIILGTYLLSYRLLVGPVSEVSAIFAAFLSIMGFQFLFFGMWMDMENNRKLR